MAAPCRAKPSGAGPAAANRPNLRLHRETGGAPGAALASGGADMKTHRLAALSALALCALPLNAAAQDKIVIRFSTVGPPADFTFKGMEKFRDEMNAKGGGRFDVQIHPAGTLFRMGAEVPAIQRGNLEMSTLSTFEVSQQMPEFGFINRAYLFRDYAHFGKFFEGALGARYAKAVEDKMGLTIFCYAYLGVRHINLRVARTVNAPDDLKGLKMRMPPGPDWLLLGQAVGVTPTPLAMPEVYMALQTGTIDGQDNTLTLIWTSKFHEVSKQIVLTRHMYQTVFYAIGTPFLKKQKPEDQALIRAAANEGCKVNNALRLRDEETVAGELKKRGIAITEPKLEAFRANADKVYGAADLAKAWDKKFLDETLALK
jgi:tripartite ATP-independent transporter DctP family solute receptor